MAADPNVPISVEEMSEHDLLAGIYTAVTTIRTVVVLAFLAALLAGAIVLVVSATA